MLRHALLLMVLLPVTSQLQLLADPAEEADRKAFEELQRIAAAKPAYTKEVGDRVTALIMGLWTHPVYRHPVATVMNLDGGFVDRIFNRATLESEPEDLRTFAQVDERLYRGGQPTEEGFRRLKAKGVGTVVNLRLEEPSEEATVKRLGMDYLYLPIPDTDRPSPEQIERWMRLVDDEGAGKVYVHCAWGVNRTGTMVALWRIARGMPNGAALEEARKYGFDEDRLKADRSAELIRTFRRQ